MNRYVLGLLALLLVPLMGVPAAAQGISQKVAVCDPAYTGRCIKPDVNGAVPVTGSFTPSGTGDVNLKQVNGATVNVGAGAASTGTQRVTTSTDSTIGTVTAVTTLATLTNPVGIKGADGSTIASTTNAVPTVASAAVVSTNGSTTVTTGNTYQSVFTSSAARRGCLIQNPTTATEILNVRVKSVAVFTIPVGGTFQCGGPAGLVISDLIEVTAVTTGHAFTAIVQP